MNNLSDKPQFKKTTPMIKGDFEVVVAEMPISYMYLEFIDGQKILFVSEVQNHG